MTAAIPAPIKIKIDELTEAAKSQIPEAEAEHFETLVGSLFNHVSAEDINQYKDDDLKGLMATAFRALQSEPTRKTTIFNPTVEEHGWQSPHTVFLLHHKDVRYLIDSIRNALIQRQVKMHKIFHTYLTVKRDNNGAIISVAEQNKSGIQEKSSDELLLYIEIDHHSKMSDIKELNKALEQTVKDVEIVAQDYPAMADLIDKVTATLDHVPNASPGLITESKAFLQWLKGNHFTFLAYDEYEADQEGIKSVPKTGLGLFRQYGQPKQQLFKHMSEKQIEAANQNAPILFAKSGHLSTVHRSAYSDYVVVKKYDKKGNMIGGFRFMGLYKHSVYLDSAITIPIIRQKIQSILDSSSIPPETYNYAELSHILGTFPRDELFQASTDHLLKVSLNVLYLQERRKVKLFLRENIDCKFISAIFYAPRDILSARLRHQVYDLLSQHLDVENYTVSTWFSESSLARCRYVFKLKSPLTKPLDEAALERKATELARDWNDELQAALADAFGEEQGVGLYRSYQNSFPASYIEDNDPRIAVADIDRMQKLAGSDTNFALSFYRHVLPDHSELKIKIYHRGAQLSLSDMIPVLENFGLKVIEELPYDIEQGNEIFWIYNFTVAFPDNPDIEPENFREDLSNAFIAIWATQADNDDFNQLVLKAGLNWRQISMLRAYSRYMKQIRSGFSQKYIASALIKHTDITKKLIAYFDCRFNPDKKRSEKTAVRLVDQLESLFESVASLSEDHILRQFLELMGATLRTNFFQKNANGLLNDYLSFKLDPEQIKNIPLPRPKYEIFVYSPRVEGVHLRGGKVARGGLRWSDRIEDFRTEILGLVKAQQVKNAVIVPVGAKGGFIAKRLPPVEDREAFWQEGIACYKLFIRGLLDLTDNVIEGDIVAPKQVVRYDEDDTYLVVAADKGTATFSDIANEISKEYGHWLGDAFASGGSNGYDHKKMGITARGAWVSVQRHFREMGINVQEQTFTVVGIGDMSGDVFGNGMLLSDKIRLVGAFNHMHIFVDPNPDAAATYEERKRLFQLPRSSWQDYNAELISKGGGIFSRSAKSIKLSPEIKQLVNTLKTNVTPTELISLLLQSNIDMLWNGGIGTYVKASTEQHADVGDKANDALRIDANKLQCKVIGEGGNLGLTQKARIEYGLLGGSIFTDFIDNAGGVDCSDHEVNIKILLDKQVADGELTEKQRNRRLELMTESVAEKVLKNNYRQTQAIALANIESVRRTEEYRRVIKYLESTGKLNRALEFLPDDDVLAERKAQQYGLAQSELSILISYVKADMKEALMQMDHEGDKYLLQPVESAFPQELVNDFKQAVEQHPLKKEIIATQIANDIFNHMSISFVERLQQSTGAAHADIAKAYMAAKEIFALDDIWQSVEDLDYKVESDLQYHMMLRASRLIRRASRWLIKNHRAQLVTSKLIDLYKGSIQGLRKKLPSLLPEPLREQWDFAREELIRMGAPQSLAETLASCEYLYDFLGIISVSNALDKDIHIVACYFFALAEKLDLDDFAEHLENKMPTTTHWQALARESLRDDLEWQQRQLTQNILSSNKCKNSSVQEVIERWLSDKDLLTNRWKSMITELSNHHNDSDTSILSIAIRELSDLSQATAV